MNCPDSEGEERPALRAMEVLAVLERHRVEYVLVGGFAAQLHGAQRPTFDVDVTPSTTAGNLDRLAGALRELQARIRVDGVDGGLAFDAGGESLRGVQTLNLVTSLGEMDVMFAPSGTGGFEDLERAAVPYLLGTVQVRLAALADIIRSKTAAGRPKDLRALAELHALAAGGQPQAAGWTAADVVASSYPTPPGTVSPQAAAQARLDAARAATRPGRSDRIRLEQEGDGRGSRH